MKITPEVINKANLAFMIVLLFITTVVECCTAAQAYLMTSAQEAWRD